MSADAQGTRADDEGTRSDGEGTRVDDEGTRGDALLSFGGFFVSWSYAMVLICCILNASEQRQSRFARALIRCFRVLVHRLYIILYIT